MRIFLIAVGMLATPASAATLLGNAQCRATTEPSSRVVQQLWGGDTVRIIGRTTGWVKLDRGENGCWVSVGIVGEGSSLVPPAIDRGALRESPCRCDTRRLCKAERGRRYCLTRTGKVRWRR
jgi:hypothetical protein